MGWSTPQDLSPEPVFGLLTHMSMVPWLSLNMTEDSFGWYMGYHRYCDVRFEWFPVLLSLHISKRMLLQTLWHRFSSKIWISFSDTDFFCEVGSTVSVSQLMSPKLKIPPNINVWFELFLVFSLHDADSFLGHRVGQMHHCLLDDRNLLGTVSCDCAVMFPPTQPQHHSRVSQPLLQSNNHGHRLELHRLRLFSLYVSEQRSRGHKLSTDVCFWPQFGFCHDDCIELCEVYKVGELSCLTSYTVSIQCHCLPVLWFSWEGVWCRVIRKVIRAASMLLKVQAYWTVIMVSMSNVHWCGALELLWNRGLKQGLF